MPTKLAYIGGGSLFVPSIINGIAQVMQGSAAPFEVDMALYDIAPEKAARMVAYADIVREAWGVPLRARVTASRAEALEGADLVFVSVWLPEEHALVAKLLETVGPLHDESGPVVAAWTVALAPWTLGVAAEMRRYCPDALFISLMNPTDVLTDVVARGGGVRAAGLCVEVDQMRAELAYYYRVPIARVHLRHAGVNHDGWILGLTVDGQEGYALWPQAAEVLYRDSDAHPDNWWIGPLFDLTGHFRSSGHHFWPYLVDFKWAPEELRATWRGERARMTQALEQALATRTPLSDPPTCMIARRSVNYPATGLTIGQIMQSIATGLAHTVPLQVRNDGAVANFPADVVVEVPTLVQGRALQPLAMGALPDWLGGYTRLLAIQRHLIADYVLTGDLTALQHALATLPMYGTLREINAFVAAVHAARRGA
jgi:alpha-galactosidase/6-phospho-beta-glucosidase family protein